MMSGFIIGESSRNISMLEVLGYRKGEARRFVLTAYGIAMALAGRKLKKVDMVETLKCPNE